MAAENNRPIVDGTGLCVRTENTESRVVYRVADRFDVTITRNDAKVDLWVAEIPRLKVVNASGDETMTAGYTSEKAQPFKGCVDHVFIALGRDFRDVAKLVFSETKAKQGVAELTATNSLQAAKLTAITHAAAIIGGSSTEPLTDAERAMVDPTILALADKVMAPAAETGTK